MHTYMLILHETPAEYASMSPAQLQDIIQSHQRWAADLAERGLLAGGEKLVDEGGRHLRVKGAEVVASDGPYAEAHDVVGGYYLIKAADDLEAERVARECPHLFGSGWVEVRKIDVLD
ncbi:MAG: dehydrogenase [Burkholderiales bacterium]|nr:dehydrogenase [Burkholderiales bacterium]